MKRVFIYLFIFLFPLKSFADFKFTEISKDWGVGVWTDDFDDSKSCAIMTTTRVKKKKGSGLVLFINHSHGQHAILMADGNIDGIGIKYRIDKNNPVQFGYEYEFQSDSDIYILRNKEFDQLINDFKKGNTLVYKITSSNQFVDDGRDKISLKGFTIAYNKAKECI